MPGLRNKKPVRRPYRKRIKADGYIPRGCYIVDYIVDHKKEEDGEHFYVKWEGYSEEDNTWEPRKNLPGWLIQQYFEKKASVAVSKPEQEEVPLMIEEIIAGKELEQENTRGKINIENHRELIVFISCILSKEKKQINDTSEGQTTELQTKEQGSEEGIKAEDTVEQVQKVNNKISEEKENDPQKEKPKGKKRGRKKKRGNKVVENTSREIVETKEEEVETDDYLESDETDEAEFVDSEDERMEKERKEKRKRERKNQRLEARRHHDYLVQLFAELETREEKEEEQTKPTICLENRITIYNPTSDNNNNNNTNINDINNINDNNINDNSIYGDENDKNEKDEKNEKNENNEKNEISETNETNEQTDNNDKDDDNNNNNNNSTLVVTTTTQHSTTSTSNSSCMISITEEKQSRVDIVVQNPSHYLYDFIIRDIIAECTSGYVAMVSEKETGCALVTYSNYELACQAIEELHGKQIYGTYLIAMFADEVCSEFQNCSSIPVFDHFVPYQNPFLFPPTGNPRYSTILQVSGRLIGTLEGECYFGNIAIPSILEVNSKGPESKIHEIYKKATNYPTIAYLTPSYASSSSLVSNFIHYLAERQTVGIVQTQDRILYVATISMLPVHSPEFYHPSCTIVVVASPGSNSDNDK